MKAKSPKREASTKVLFAGSIIVALIAVAALINNVLLFRTTVAQYVAQGYTASDVTKGLLQGQLLPGLFEPIAIYGGIALLLCAASMINQKLALGLAIDGGAGLNAEIVAVDRFDEIDEVAEPVTDDESDADAEEVTEEPQDEQPK